MNSSKPTPGIKNKEASAKNPLYMVPTLFPSGKLFWTKLFLKTGLSRGISPRAPGVKPKICYFGLRALQKHHFKSHLRLNNLASLGAVFCGSNSREELIGDDKLRRLVYTPNLLWVVAWFWRKGCLMQSTTSLLHHSQHEVGSQARDCISKGNL